MKFNKLTKQVALGCLIYAALVSFVIGSFDLQTLIVYPLIGGIVAYLATTQKQVWNSKKIFILGAVISLAYHFAVGSILGQFTLPAMTNLIFSAIEQGVILVIIYKIGGGNK